jgi:putative endonuclease
MNYYVYIIYSNSKDLYYIGHTNNLVDRLSRHNNNRNKFTKGKGPWKLVTNYNCKSRSEAFQLEIKLKSFKNSDKAVGYLKKLVQSIPT